MQSKNKKAPSAAERRHIERIKNLPCVICGEYGVEVHEPKQGLWFASMPLCVTHHRHPVYGWHGERQGWKAAKMDELDAIAETVQMLMLEQEYRG